MRIFFGRGYSQPNAVYLRLRFLLSFDFLIEDFFWTLIFFGRRSSEIGPAGSGADLFNTGNRRGRRLRPRPASRRPDGTQIAAPGDYHIGREGKQLGGWMRCRGIVVMYIN